MSRHEKADVHPNGGLTRTLDFPLLLMYTVAPTTSATSYGIHLGILVEDLTPETNETSQL